MTRAKKRSLHLLALGALTLSGCTDFAGYDLDYFWGNIPFLSTMRGSVTYDPYELPRLPAPNTVPVQSPNGEIPPHFTQAQLDSAAATLVNPFAGGAATGEVLERGRVQYDRQCSVCHGPSGAGNGTVVGNGKFPFAPALNTPTSAGRSDGYLYGIIVVGRGLMPAYGERMSHLDRWAVVSYVRALQRGGGVAPSPAGSTPSTAPAPIQRPRPGQPGDTVPTGSDR